MPRPVNADATATKARVLRAASRLFSDHGRHGGSIRAIAREADVSVATVHHYFGNKEALYAACVEEMYAAMVAMQGELASALAAGGDPRAQIDAAVRRGFAFVCEHTDAVRLQLRQVVDAGEIDEEQQARHRLPTLEAGVALLAEATGQPAAALRLPMLSLTHLMVRYAVASPADRARQVGGGATPGEATEAIIAHLLAVAHALLPSPRATSRPNP